MNAFKTFRFLNKAEFISVAINLIGFFVLLVCVSLSPSYQVFDEVYHLPLVELLNQYGLSYRFLRGTGQSAPGPLYPIIHYLFQPFTHLQAPAIRFINPFLLVLIVIVIAVILQILYRERRAWIIALTIMGIPISWTISGMALTEIPAMLFATLGIFLLLISLEKSGDTTGWSLAIATLGGLCLGAAIAGRQTYLVTYLALPLLMINKPRKYWKFLAIFLIASAIFPALIFSVWEGLLPPGQKSLGKGYSLENGLISFSIAGFLFFLLSPQWFSLKTSHLVMLSVPIIVLNFIFEFIYFAPSYYVFSKIIPAFILISFYKIISSFLLAFAILFLISSLKNCRDNYKDSRFLFFTILVLLICATSFKITHYYSSRYTATAIPFIILLSAYYSRENYFKVTRLLFGNILGFLMLISYYSRPWN